MPKYRIISQQSVSSPSSDLERTLSTFDLWKQTSPTVVGDFVQLVELIKPPAPNNVFMNVDDEKRVIKLSVGELNSNNQLVWVDKEINHLPSIFLIKNTPLSDDGFLFKVEEKSFLCEYAEHYKVIDENKMLCFLNIDDLSFVPRPEITYQKQVATSELSEVEEFLHLMWSNRIQSTKTIIKVLQEMLISLNKNSQSFNNAFGIDFSRLEASLNEPLGELNYLRLRLWIGRNLSAHFTNSIFYKLEEIEDVDCYEGQFAISRQDSSGNNYFTGYVVMSDEDLQSGKKMVIESNQHEYLNFYYFISRQHFTKGDKNSLPAFLLEAKKVIENQLSTLLSELNHELFILERGYSDGFVNQSFLR